MLVLGQSSFLEALGWSLLNSFWHFAVLWIVYLVLIHVIKNITASAKHAAALLLMLAGIVCFFSNFWYLNTHPGDNFLDYSVALNSFYFSTIYHFLRSGLNQVIPMVSIAYLVIIALLFLRLGRYMYTSKQLQTQGLHKMEARWRLYVAELAQRMSITKKVKIWLSDKIDSPLIIGFFKPVILLPIAMVNQLSTDQIESILLHELAHIKRNDYAVNLLIAITSIIFFFNPFARLFINAIRREREYCCDDWVLQFRYDPHQYASALLTLEQNRKGLISMGIAANGTHKHVLLQRVHRIMQLPYPKKNQNIQSTAFIGIVFLMSMALLIRPGVKPLAAFKPVVIVENNIKPITPNAIYIPRDARRGDLIINNKLVSIKRKVEPEKNMEQPTPVQDEIVLDEVANTFSKQNEELNRLAAIETQQRDFSIAVTKTFQVKPTITIENNYPYVPSSSFSYQLIDDTSYPKYKVDSYRERMAKEDAVKAQLALKKINWKKLEKELGNNKAALEKIKKDIEQELASIDWKKIQDESTETIRQQEQELSEKLMRDYQETKEKYLRQQALYNNLREQFRAQENLKVEDENKQQESSLQAPGGQKKKKVVVI